MQHNHKIVYIEQLEKKQDSFPSRPQTGFVSFEQFELRKQQRKEYIDNLFHNCLFFGMLCMFFTWVFMQIFGSYYL